MSYMSEITYLNEKDMGYIQREAEAGRYVILDIPVELLLNLSLEEFTPKDPKKPDLKELTDWVQKKAEEWKLEEAKKEKTSDDKAGYKTNNTKRTQPVTEKESNVERLRKALEENQFSEEQWEVIREALEQKLDEEKLLVILNPLLSAENMKSLIEYYR